MNSDVPWVSIFNNLNDPRTRPAARKALEALVSEVGDSLYGNQDMIAEAIEDGTLNGSLAVSTGLKVLQEAVPMSPVAVRAALKCSREEEPTAVRLEATKLLALVAGAREEDVKTRLYELVSDSDDGVRTLALGAVPVLASGGSEQPLTSPLHVIPDDVARNGVMDLLDSSKVPSTPFKTCNSMKVSTA